MPRLRILLADDHVVMRAGLRLLLERQPDFEVVGEASDGRQAVALVESELPDVVVMDIAMPNLNGIEAARRIAGTRTAVVILSMHSDESYVMRALNAGVRGYLLKDSAETDIVAAIRAARHGRTFFSPRVSRLLREDFSLRRVEDSFDLLTSREREILQLIGEGNSNKEIAAALHLSVYTVETHRGNILEKLGLHSVPELILYAVRKGLVS